MGRVWGVDAVAKNNSTSFYGSIITIAESPLVEGLLYAGTDDGLIQISEDGGQNWRKVEEFPTLSIPPYASVSDIEASPHDPNTVFAALYNFQKGDFKPYLIKSVDRGRTWTSITGDLPERGSTYTLALDHVKPELMFVGTEFGLFCTLGRRHEVDSAAGVACRRSPFATWRSSVARTILAVGTFGRGFYILDNYTPLRELSNELLTKDGALLRDQEGADVHRVRSDGWRRKGVSGCQLLHRSEPAVRCDVHFLPEGLSDNGSEPTSGEGPGTWPSRARTCRIPVGRT